VEGGGDVKLRGERGVSRRRRAAPRMRIPQLTEESRARRMLPN